MLRTSSKVEPLAIPGGVDQATASQQLEITLIRAYQCGDRPAGDRLVRVFYSFVTSIAHDYRLWGVNHEDLVQQGCIGLLKAASRFDGERAHNLRTYAGYWIRAEIRDYVVRCYRIVRLGTTRTERRALRAFRVNEIKTPAELAECSGMPIARCEQLWPLLARGDSQLDDPRSSRSAAAALATDVYSPESLVMFRQRNELLQARVSAALQSLTARERRIVEARMMADEPSTLDALGVELGLSRERVRQLEAGAKAKVKEQLGDDLMAA